jgi:hypothetical protein
MDITSSYMEQLFMILVNEKSNSTKLITALIGGTACFQKKSEFHSQTGHRETNMPVIH